MSPEYKAAWYLKNRARIREAQRLRYATDHEFSERIKASAKKRYAENRENLLKRSLEYAKANRPKMRVWNSEWKKRNSDKVAADRAFRRAIQRNATPPWVDRKEIEKFYSEARELTIATKVDHHVDHRYPLIHSRFSGLHVPWNLRVITAAENWSKNNRIPETMLHVR
jgi:hypothetical protein